MAAHEGLWEQWHMVDVEFPTPHVMYLHRGWKTFARLHSLTDGLTLHFKLMEGVLLSLGHHGGLDLAPSPFL